MPLPIPSLSSLSSLSSSSLPARTWPSRLALGALVVAAAGCAPPPPDKDRTAPRVLAVAPVSPIVPVDTALALTFSEVLDPSTVDADPTTDTTTVALVPRTRADSFITDLKTAGLNDSNEDDVVAIDIVVDDDTLRITPRAPLDPLTAYSLIVSAEVRDAAQNPLVDALGLAAPFRYDFTTDAGPPSVVSADVAASSLVAPNRRRITVTFNQPVQRVTSDSLFLSPATAVEALLVDENRTTATLLLPEGAGCERLTPGATYTLTATDAIRADNGQSLTPFSTTFTTGAACDTAPLLLVGGPEVIAGELAATVRFLTSRASTTEVRFGVGGVLDCLGGACPVLGNPARTAVAGSSPPRFLHSVEIAGLQLGQTYDVVVTAEDDVGNAVRASTSFVTAPLPRIAINEVMANPTTPEPAGEFIELANFGPDPVDVSGWGLLVDGGDDAGGCTAVLSAGFVIPPAAFLVVAQDDFDGRYNLTPDVVTMLLADACTLSNRAQPVALVDGDGRPVSSMSSYATTNPSADGRSIERIAADAADVETSFCRARSDVEATPGRANSVTANGCEP
jgi:hypothetical protein